MLALIGLGIGLGIKWNQAEDVANALRLGNTNANFNYSSFFGIPVYLPWINGDDVFRPDELDMKTGFVVSNQTTTRVYTINITQVLAAPDGKSIWFIECS